MPLSHAVSRRDEQAYGQGKNETTVKGLHRFRWWLRQSSRKGGSSSAPLFSDRFWKDQMKALAGSDHQPATSPQPVRIAKVIQYPATGLVL